MDIPSAAELEGATGGRYAIEGVFATGGMGAVFSARNRALGSRVAIKVLPSEVAFSAVRLARFKREASLAANLSHPHIVPVFEFDASQGLAYFVMPFVEGRSLDDHLRESGKLSYVTIRELVEQVGSALAFAHERDVVHRDIKPGNILREEASGRWLITDFGVAHVTTAAGETDITQTGAVIGTPAYMSPEQSWGGAIDPRTDLYAFAAVIYQAITGTSIIDLRDDLAHKPEELERAVRRAVPSLKPALARALVWPLAVAKEDRPESVEQWLGAIREAERTKHPRAWFAAAVVGSLAVAAWLFFQRPTGPAARPTETVVAVLPITIVGGEQSGNLSAALAMGFDRKLRWLPDHRAIGPSVIARQYGDEDQELDTLFAVARSLEATQVLEADGTVRGDSLSLTVRVYDAANQQLRIETEESGLLDSLDTIVTQIVVDAFATQATRERADLPRSFPNGLEAISAWWHGTELFRRGSYASAVERLQTVIDLDPEFAPAHFQRMLAILFDTRPSQYSAVIHTALDAATARREDLDPFDQELLDAYTALLNEGDIRGAEATALTLTERYRRQVEPHFLLGFIQFNFRSLLGRELGEARYAFQQAVQIDPEFAIALAHLAAIAVVENNREQAQRYIGRLRSVDSTSIWSEAAGMADSLLYHRSIAVRGQVIRSFGRRRPGVLEIFAVGAGELDAPATVRPVAEDALDTLYQRSAERQLALRMKLATRLATGRYGSADSILADAQRLGVPQDERDRWAVLTAVTAVLPPEYQLATEAAQREAVARLSTLANDVEAQWLVARWRLERDRAAAGGPIRAVTRIAADSTLSSPLARSLALDLRAVQRLSAGDSLAADTLWTAATRYYSVDRLIYGFTGSLWPIRLAQAELANALGDHGRALQIIRTFEQMAGFIDQVAWPKVLLLKARVGTESADPQTTSAAYAKLTELLTDANGAGIALRDSILGLRP